MSSTGEDDRGRIHVRRMVAADGDFVARLAARLGERGLPAWRDQEAMIAFHRRYAADAVAAGVRDTGNHGAVFLAEGHGSEPLGVVHVQRAVSGLTGEAQAYVAMLAVTVTAEGRGVGRALMAAAEEWARQRGFRVIALDVFAANQGARAFYARLGYQEETLTLIKEL